jgi:hypothetical protein
VPNEIKRKRGTARADRGVPSASSVVALPMAEGVPDCPEDFGLAARGLWARVWQTGITWISPLSDIEAAEQTCRLADDLEVARRRYRVTSDPADGRMVATFDGSLASALSRLGFDPAARTRLGVAEVKRQSKLEELIAKRGR